MVRIAGIVPRAVVRPWPPETAAPGRHATAPSSNSYATTGHRRCIATSTLSHDSYMPGRLAEFGIRTKKGQMDVLQQEGKGGEHPHPCFGAVSVVPLNEEFGGSGSARGPSGRARLGFEQGHRGRI